MNRNIIKHLQYENMKLAIIDAELSPTGSSVRRAKRPSLAESDPQARQLLTADLLQRDALSLRSDVASLYSFNNILLDKLFMCAIKRKC